MATVLRIKRRLEENPQDALVLMCKRIKTDQEEISPSLFVFRGTVDNQETTHVKVLLPKTDIKLQTVPNVENIIQKMRKERKEVAAESRYEIVNCSRDIKDASNQESEDLLNLIDLQKTVDKDSDVQYAYDLYTSWKQDFDISMIDNFVGVETDLDLYQDPLNDPSDNEGEDDDDSNDEDNWRNEYPDSEPSSIELEDMVRAMKSFDIDNDLSTDTDEDEIYEDPPDVNKDDADRYGPAYAKYKAKVMSENPDLSTNKSLIQSAPKKEDQGYKDDSDNDGFYYGEDENTEHFKKQYQDDLSSDENAPD